MSLALPVRREIVTSMPVDGLRCTGGRSACDERRHDASWTILHAVVQRDGYIYMTMTEELAKFVKAHTKLTAHNPPAFGTPLVRFRVACCAHSHRRGALMS
jgi:hypothetical protein